MMAGAEQNGAAFGHRRAGVLHRRLEIGRRDLGARRDVAQIDADTRYDAFLQRILVDRYAALAEMPGRVDVGAGMVDHRNEHRGKSVHIAGLGKGFLVGLPDAMHDRRMAGIAWGAVIEVAAEIDDLHGKPFEGTGCHCGHGE